MSIAENLNPDQTAFLTTRMICQQLAEPVFDQPEQVVAWMGAMQAQAYEMAKWAIGLRLTKGSIAAVNDALKTGKILRIHLLRPTWHWVATEDIRWMVALSAARIRAANDSFGKSRHPAISPSLYNRVDNLLGQMLEGGKALTKPEIAHRLTQAGIRTAQAETTRFLIQAETRGLICSGPDRAGKPTYAWMDDRVPASPEKPREEALAILALRYFQSHSPATLNDFLWWSGLSIREARQAINDNPTKILRETIEGTEWWIHEKTPVPQIPNKPSKEIHLLPPFDEYLIGYKNRTQVLNPMNQNKAFNRWGTFYPVILHQGQIIGNWQKIPHRKEMKIDLKFFPEIPEPPITTFHQALEQYRNFLSEK